MWSSSSAEKASQGIIDRYVAGEDVPLTELRRVWTETPGWVPGPTPLGYVNFFAHVRAANLKLPPQRRIRVCLGEPKVDWSKINSYQDLVPYVKQRDDNYTRIIRDEILEKQKKTLLNHRQRAYLCPAMLSAKFNEAYPNTLAAVMPFVGYLEAECNAKFMADAKNWPVPALAGPIAGTWLKSRLRLPGCNFVAPEEIEKMKATPVTALPPTIASVAKLIHALINMVSGEDADAML